jgi:hypothetical protein
MGYGETAMQWESTDQFGNLMVATCDATDSEGISEALSEMVRAVFERTPEGVTFSIDSSYREVAAPSPDQVSHILTLPYLGGGESCRAEVERLLAQVVADKGLQARIIGPWD